jgi:hypothetical protein
MIRHWLRDPLAHFLIAGAVIWAGLALVGEPVDPASRTIELSRERQAGIAFGFERMMGRAPTDAEMDSAIERWVREEVLYREALRLGLDEGDAVVRRRLATKMDELAGAEAALARPSEADLERWLVKHPDKYREGDRLTFRQVYYSSESAAARALASRDPVGEPISLPAEAVAVPLAQIRGTYGEAFTARLAELEPSSEWRGPVASGYGWHLVRLETRSAGKTPQLSAVRDRIEADWRAATIAERRQRAYAVLRGAYTVAIE